MKNSETLVVAPGVRTDSRKIGRDAVHLVGDLLPVFDFSGILLAAWIATLLLAGSVDSAVASGIWTDGARAALAAAMLAPLILCDKAFVLYASAGQTGPLIRCYVVRFLMLSGVVGVIGLACRALDHLPAVWLSFWFASSLAVTALVRWTLVTALRALERNGVITEAIAVVGAGALADRLIQQLEHTHGNRIELIGVFDDRPRGTDGSGAESTGSIDDLIEIGKSRPMDWIVMTSPDISDDPTRSIVHRLKGLAVPIGLCPQTLSPNWAAELTDQRYGWHSTRAALIAILPPWILTFLALPAAWRSRQRDTARNRLSLALDNYDLDQFTGIAARFGASRYGYVVTPNADHLIRLHREPPFRALYADAAYVLLDSRFIANLMKITRKRHLAVCTGSDLTAALFEHVVKPDDRVVLIGGTARHADHLNRQYGLQNLVQHVPPMGFAHDSLAMEACLSFIESHSPFRYCLLAVGSPQQEMVAQRLKARGSARGMALCIGASINFMTGDERRAPASMQRCGLEWMFRLSQAPVRMSHRYLVRGPQLFGLLRRTDIVLRNTASPMVTASREAIAPTLNPVALQRTV